MTIQLDLSPDVEAKLRQEAERRDIPVDDYIESLVLSAVGERIPAFGIFKGLLPTVEEYLEEKHHETALEDQRF